MNEKTFKILYLNRGIWKTVKDEENKDLVYSSVDAAKAKVDEVRSKGEHPLCLVHHVMIYRFNGNLMSGKGVRY